MVPDLKHTLLLENVEAVKFVKWCSFSVEGRYRHYNELMQLNEKEAKNHSKKYE